MADYLAAGANSTVTRTASARQAQTGWQNSENGNLYVRLNGSESPVSVTAGIAGQTYTIRVASISASPGTSVSVTTG